MNSPLGRIVGYASLCRARRGVFVGAFRYEREAGVTHSGRAIAKYDYAIRRRAWQRRGSAPKQRQ